MTLNISLQVCFHLIEMFYCETSIERVSHKARFNINWLCCAVESFLVAERHVNDNKLFIH